MADLAHPASPTTSSQRRNNPKTLHSLLEGDESSVGGSKTGLSVSGGDVRHGELGEVVAGHLGPDLDGVEDLSVVDGDHRSDHLRDNDHVCDGER